MRHLWIEVRRVGDTASSSVTGALGPGRYSQRESYRCARCQTPAASVRRVDTRYRRPGQSVIRRPVTPR
jgi:hypothetical protein